MSESSRRAIQFEGLSERKDPEEILFAYRALLNYIIYLEEKINPGERNGNQKIYEGREATDDSRDSKVQVRE